MHTVNLMDLGGICTTHQSARCSIPRSATVMAGAVASQHASHSRRAQKQGHPHLGEHQTGGELLADFSARVALERLFQASRSGSRGVPHEQSGCFLESQLVQLSPPAQQAPITLAASTDLEPKPQVKRNQERQPDYFANVGDAIRTLREDIPDLFTRDLNYSIYRDDIVFKDPRNTFAGLKNYKLIFWSLRFHGSIFFSKLYVEVKRIWQPSDDVIKMRWTVHGVPRVPWEATGLFDGISTYKLDNSGKVYEHSVDNVLLRDPPMVTNPLLAGLNLVSGTPQQQPCPGAWGSALSSSQAPPDAVHGTLTPVPVRVVDQHGRAGGCMPRHAIPTSALLHPTVHLSAAESTPCRRRSSRQGMAPEAPAAAPTQEGQGVQQAHEQQGSQQQHPAWQVSDLDAMMHALAAACSSVGHQQWPEELMPPAAATAAAAARSVAASQKLARWSQFSWVRLYASSWASVSLLAALHALWPQPTLEPSCSQ